VGDGSQENHTDVSLISSKRKVFGAVQFPPEDGGITAFHPSVCPSGLTPIPTIILPSAEIAVASPNTQPVRSNPNSFSNNSLRFCIPVSSLHIKAKYPSAELLTPTMVVPSSETSFALE